MAALLSVIVVTKNEERNLSRCLASVSWCDEIIVVDSGSTDKTIEIAKSFGARIFERDWPGDGPQKFFGISQAKHQWCLVLDADEEVTDDLRESIQLALNNPQNISYKIHRRSFFLNKIIKYGDWGRDWIVRLFDKTSLQWTQAEVHSRCDVEKSSATALHGYLLHYTQDSIELSINKMNQYTSLSAGLLQENGKHCSLLKAMVHSHWSFFRSFIMRRGFLSGWRGYLIAKQIASSSFYKYAKVWEYDQQLD